MKSPLFFKLKKTKTKETDMNCKTAQKVWSHKDGFLSGLKQACPGVLERIDETVSGLINGATNPFFETVKRKVGGLKARYYVTHADDNDPLAEMVHDVIGDAAARGELEIYFSKKYGQPIALGNLCCSGCNASVGELAHSDLVAIQNAAVRTESDGSDIELC